MSRSADVQEMAEKIVAIMELKEAQGDFASESEVRHTHSLVRQAFVYAYGSLTKAGRRHIAQAATPAAPRRG